MKGLADKNSTADRFRTFLFLGIRVGILCSGAGLVAHSLWSNLDAVEYTILTGFIIGFFVGLCEMVFSHSRIGRLGYTPLLVLRIIAWFTVSMSTIYLVLLAYLNANGLTSGSLSDPRQFEEIRSVYFLANVNVLYVLGFVMVGSFLWQLKSFFERGAILNYLLGRYHKPRSEERIFMFLDLDNATTLAEKLGSDDYSALLSDFFYDLDPAFSKTKGYIHQYVGDEVVVIWKPAQGLRQNNCIRSFFLARDIMEARREYYMGRYGRVPSFKASLHLGNVTVTEVGVSRKGIAYHGDTINTASRICASAHVLGRDLLVSKDLHDRTESDPSLEFEDLGEQSLRGKDDKVRIYGVRVTGWG